MTLNIKDRFPYLVKDYEKTINEALLLVKLKDGVQYDLSSTLKLGLGQGDSISPTEDVGEATGAFGQLLSVKFTNLNGSTDNDWILVAEDHEVLSSDKMEDLLILFTYTVTISNP
jgi:hypothetical protein